MDSLKYPIAGHLWFEKCTGMPALKDLSRNAFATEMLGLTKLEEEHTHDPQNTLLYSVMPHRPE
jgi:hypothetical protein